MDIPAHEMTPRVRDAILSLLTEVDSLRRDLEATQRRLLEVEKLADLDPLSPIANRRAFVRELSRTLSYVERYNVPASVLFFDVNGLKAINDTHGHGAGDAVLIHISEILRTSIRGSDVAGRLGGDEYAVILTHTDEAQATEKAQQLARRIAEVPVVHNAISLTALVAFGVYTFGPGENPTTILERADARMYAHKRASREG